VLRTNWDYKGFVLSDWGATHSTVKASAAGLDNEEPLDEFYGDSFKQAVQSGKISMAALDAHVHRILRSEFLSGIVDHPMQKSVVDVEGGLEISREIAEHSIVLLKNDKNILPLDHTKLHSIAVIGANADIGMISGSGSAQVDPPGRPNAGWQAHVWFPPAPLKSLRRMAPDVDVKFNSGAIASEAAATAKSADAAIVFVHQWSSEDMDLPNLSLPDNQDTLIDQVASANPHTVVVLETGTAVTMPWIDKTSAVIEAWYAGSKGADAVANILFGTVNPSAKLPMTFPQSEADLPHPKLIVPATADLGPAAVMRTGEAKPTFQVTYDEGLKVGYKWYDAEKKPVLFPFGFGLSYTTYAYSDLQVSFGKDVSVTFTVKNTGSRAGEEIAEVYAALPASAGEPPKRLVGFSKVHLNAGQGTEVTVNLDPRFLSVYNEKKDAWELTPGSYSIMVGGSSQNLPLTSKIELH
jgi:beta-glucosidase